MIKYLSARFSNSKLNRKLSVVYVGIIIGYFVLFLSMYFVFYAKEVDEQVKKNDKSFAEISVDALLSENKNVNNITKAISTDNVVRRYLKADAENEKSLERPVLESLYQYVFLLDYISSIYIVRTDGKYIGVVADTTNVNKASLENENWSALLEEAKGGAVYKRNGNGAFHRKTGENTISFMRAIYDIDTLELAGYLSVNMNMDFLESSWEHILETEGVGVSVWDAEGKLCSFGEEVVFPNQKKEVYSDIIKKERDSYSVYCTEIEDWGIFYQMERKLIPSKQQKEMMLFLFGSTFLFSVLTWGIVHYIIRIKITSPIEKLVESMGKVKSGWLYRVSIKTDPDEIGILKDSYNMMLVEMNKLLTTLVDKEKEKQKMELEILQEQIKPHFLYNTLYNIENLAMENRNEEVIESLQILGDFYRRFLSKGKRAVTLKEEIEIIKDYLKLQSLRYEGTFVFDVSMGEGTENLMIPKLTLQPLVENSIYHGVRLKGEECLISVITHVHEESVWIHIFDSGVGMNQEQVCQASKKETGMGFGVKSTIERLRNFYHVDDVMEIRSEEGEYTEVILKLPKERKASEYGRD